MYKKILLFIVIIILSNFFISCSINDQKIENIDINTVDLDSISIIDGIDKYEDYESEKSIENRDPIIEKINSMTLDEKIGQMFIMGMDGYYVDDFTNAMIEDYHIGGIILFGRNIRDSNQLLELTNSLNEVNNKIPLFISIDEEGGRVSRMPKEVLNIPSCREIGKKNDAMYAFEVGSTIGMKIKSLGLNMNFAPVLDIDSNPQNPVIGDRSFGGDDEIVSKMGMEVMKGLRSENIISVVKHFPGHGDTSVDSHIGLPRIDKDLESVLQFEIIPFKKAIENHVDGIMIAHILFSRIDPDNPASLSKIIITDLLREELDYNGVVITDDMTMGAILENYAIVDASVQAIMAGADIILLSHGNENKVNAIKGIKEAVVNNKISMERVDESVYRILKLKEKYHI